MLNLHQPGGSVGGGALADGSNVTNPATWQANLGVPSVLDSRRRALIGGQPGVALDGATTGTRITSALTGQNIGTGDFSVWLRFRVPALTTAQEVALFSVGTLTTGLGINSFYAQLYGTTAGLNFRLSGGTSSYEFYGGSIGSLVQNYAGQVIDLVATRAGSVLKIYLNGNEQTLTGLIAVGGTAPANWAATVTSSNFVLGQGATACFPDRIYRAALFNRALSQADVTDLIVNGVADADQWGTQTALVSGATLNGNFETWTVAGTAGSSNGTATDWVAYTSGAGNTVTRNGAAPIGGTYDALLTMGGTAGYSYVAPANVTLCVVGKRYRARISAKRVSGSGSLTMQNFNPYTTIKTITLATGSVVDDVTEYISEATRPYWIINTTNLTVQVDNASIERIGALVDLNLGEGAGLCFTDRGTNNLHGIGNGGVSHVVPGREGCVRVRTTASGNTQLGGAGIIPANGRIRCIAADAVSGTPTVTMGNASGGAQHVASVALTAGLNDLTAVNRFNTTGNLWVNVSVTATVDWTVIYDLVD